MATFRSERWPRRGVPAGPGTLWQPAECGSLSGGRLRSHHEDPAAGGKISLFSSLLRGFGADPNASGGPKWLQNGSKMAKMAWISLRSFFCRKSRPCSWMVISGTCSSTVAWTSPLPCAFASTPCCRLEVGRTWTIYHQTTSCALENHTVGALRSIQPPSRKLELVLRQGLGDPSPLVQRQFEAVLQRCAGAPGDERLGSGAMRLSCRGAL